MYNFTPEKVIVIAGNIGIFTALARVITGSFLHRRYHFF
jgi:hypothetical protein